MICLGNAMRGRYGSPGAGLYQYAFCVSGAFEHEQAALGFKGDEAQILYLKDSDEEAGMQSKKDIAKAELGLKIL